MPADTVEHIQGRHMLRCVVSAGGNLLTLVIAALNAQKAGRGDAVLPWIMGARVVTAAGAFNASNADSTGTHAITTVPYDMFATNSLGDTVVSAVSLGVEVYYTGNPLVP